MVPKFKCVFCDEVRTIEQYRLRGNNVVIGAIKGWKVCKKHEQQLQDIINERQVRVKPMGGMKLMFLDSETTGLDTDKCGVIQISGIIDMDGETLDEFDYRIKPFAGDILQPKAMEMHGLTKETLLERQAPEEAFHALMGILSKHVDRYNKEDKLYLVGQNVSFDYDVMNRFFKKNGNDYFYAYVRYHKIDVVAITAMMSIAGVIDNLPNMKLETVAKRLKIEAKFHDSMDDIRATRKIFYQYLERIGKVEKFA